MVIIIIADDVEEREDRGQQARLTLEKKLLTLNLSS